MASTEDLVPVRRSRCPSWCSCGCGSNWVTKWLRKRLGKPLSSQAVVGIVVCVTVCVAVGLFLSFQDSMSNCEDKSEALLIVFTVFVYLGIPCLAAIAYAIRRDAFIADDSNEGFGIESLELALIFVSIVLPAVGCVALDVLFFLLFGSCFHRDADGSFSASSASYRVGLAFHVGRLVFTVAQVAMIGWCFRTKSFARQKVYTALLFTVVVLANLASWFYEIVDRPSVLCTNNNTCWDTAASKSDTCRVPFTVEYCTFVQFQLYCQSLVGTFGMLSLATMYHMWTKAREGVVENTAERRPARAPPNAADRRGTGAFVKLFSVTVAVLSVTLWAITHQATTVSSSPDYYKVVLYSSAKVLYFSLFTIWTIAGCVRTRAVGPPEYRTHVADILLLFLSAAGLLVFIGRVFWGVGYSLDPAPVTSTYTPPGCTYPITEGDFGKLRAVLIADVVLTLAQLILQTTSLLSAITHKKLEGSVESHYGILCLFNFGVWINASFFEVQSTPLGTCYTTPVLRAAFGFESWNVFLHLLQPVCTFYWLWSLLLMMRLLLQRVHVRSGFESPAETTDVDTVYARRRPTVSTAIELPPLRDAELPALRDAPLPHVTELSHDA